MDDILEIADDTSQDYLIDDHAKMVLNNDNINRARLKIDTRKWIICKLVPRVYGNKDDKSNLSHEEWLKLLM